MIRLATQRIYGVDLLDRYLPDSANYLRQLDQRPHFRATMVEREAAMAAFIALNHPYQG